MSDPHIYVCSAHKPTAVSHAARGFWTTTVRPNLIIAKGSRLDVCGLLPEGVEPIRAVPFHGNLAALLFFRGRSCKSDNLFALLERHVFTILNVNHRNNELGTICCGSLYDPAEKEHPSGPFVITDPSARIILVHIYTGSLSVIGVQSDGGINTRIYKIALLDRNVEDMAFVYPRDLKDTPIVALIHSGREGKFLKTYNLVFNQLSLVTGPIRRQPVDASASHLVPMLPPYSGILVVSDASLLLKTENETMVHKYGETRQILSWTYVKPAKDRVLMGDKRGRLWDVRFAKNTTGIGPSVIMQMDCVGRASAASTLVYLDNGIVFIGSSCGDSQVVRLKTKASPGTGNYVEVLDTYPNIGPITDFQLVPDKSQGTSDVVCASGKQLDTSLVVARNGVNFTTQFKIPLTGILDVWAISSSQDDPWHRLLCLGTPGDLRVLEVMADQMIERIVPGFECAMRTIHIADVRKGMVLQVTNFEAKILNLSKPNNGVLSIWTCPQSARVQVAASTSHGVLVACSGGVLLLLSIEVEEPTEPGKKRGLPLKQRMCRTLESEVSCLDLVYDKQNRPSFAAVGLWGSRKVQILAGPELELLAETPNCGHGVPRSVALAKMGDHMHIFIGYAGYIEQFKLQGKELVPQRSMEIGTLPVTLTKFSSPGANGKGMTKIFVANDHPAIIFYDVTKRLVSYSNLNLGCDRVSAVCGFLSKGHETESLIMMMDGNFVVGEVDPRRDLQVTKCEVGPCLRRIAHSEGLGMYLAAYDPMEKAFQGVDRPASLAVFDSQTFQKIDEFEFKSGRPEEITRVTAMKFANDPTPYFLVASAVVHAGEEEPEVGKIRVYHIENGALAEVFVTEVGGMVWYLCEFGEIPNLVLVGVCSELQVFEWDPATRSLQSVCTLKGTRAVIFDIKTRGNRILVGDMMVSLSVYEYDPDKRELREVARDLQRKWVTSCAFVSDTLLLCADNRNNLMVYHWDRSNPDPYLKRVGEFHLGDRVNRILSGALAEDSSHYAEIQEDQFGQNKILEKYIYGTLSGAIGCIFAIDKKRFDILKKIEIAIGSRPGVGGFKHIDWRSATRIGRKERETKGFIDGDLVESFFRLTAPQRESIATQVGLKEDQISCLVEMMIRNR